MKLEKWKILETEVIMNLGLFRLRKDKCELPDQRVMPSYYVIDFADWVHMVPITRNGDVVVIRQYRHAAEDHFLEIPGGATDPKNNESPKGAALRELEEETGYSSKNVFELGSHFPNPALQSNQLHSYLA